MSGIFDMFKNAMNAMSGSSDNGRKMETSTKTPEEMSVGMMFMDGKVQYVVKDIKVKKGIHCIYAETDSDAANGWFTRDSYDVIVDDQQMEE